MNQTFLTDLFLFFARFADNKSVQELFNKGRSEIAGYDLLFEKVKTIQEDNSIPGLDYVFGPNFDAVSSRVNKITDYYLFVDYGEIDCSTDSSNRMADSARLAITVACKLKEFSGDLMEQLLISEQCLSHIAHIRKTMIGEQKVHPWLKDLSRNHLFTPFLSKELSSTGWTILFNREGYDSFKVKGR
jgi:hypothetical protein